jgi:hypothetical protein
MAVWRAHVSGSDSVDVMRKTRLTVPERSMPLMRCNWDRNTSSAMMVAQLASSNTRRRSVVEGLFSKRVSRKPELAVNAVVRRADAVGCSSSRAASARNGSGHNTNPKLQAARAFVTAGA